MIDIHCHILPFVDDGAKDMEEAITMAKIACENGIKKIIATPHYIEDEKYNNAEKNTEILNKLNDELKCNNIDVEVFLGNELFITPEAINLIDSKEVATLNNTRYLLIEFPRLDMPVYIENIVYNLRLKGIIPIIAHPERYIKIMEDPNILYNLITKGALTQLNLPSLEGRYGEKVKETAEILVKHDLIHFVGSDAHSSKRATPNVVKGINILKELIDKKRLDKMLYHNAENLLKNEDIEAFIPKEYVPMGRFRKFLKEKIGI